MAVRTAVVMLNLGGPRCEQEVSGYLVRMFSDRTFIGMPPGLGPIVGKLRAKAKTQQYAAIGYSPLERWSNLQGLEMTKLLNSALPQHAPFQHYLAFRYSEPFATDAVTSALKAGAERLILFTQYPHYSCASTGNSLRDAIDAVPSANRRQVSMIHRWPTHPSYVAAWRQIVLEHLERFPDQGKEVPVVFSAHSLPSSVVWAGDMYPYEIGSTVNAVMAGLPNPYSLMWQSKVGLQTWLQPSTQKGLLTLAKQGVKQALLVPIAFTSDHIETLYELDREVLPEAKAAGMTGLIRCAAPNAHPAFLQALADVVISHIQAPTPPLHHCTHCRFPSECAKLTLVPTSFPS